SLATIDPARSLTMMAELVLNNPYDPEYAAESTAPATELPGRKFPEMPYTGRTEFAASCMNPTCGGVRAVCAHAAPAMIDNVANIALIANITFIRDAPR